MYSLPRTSFRLGVLMCGALSVGACDGGPSTAPAPGVDGRVNAVMANGKHASFAELCDLAPAAGTKPFRWPELSEPAPALDAGARYRWVNVWATWCKPCVDELPLLTRTFESWKKQGATVTLTLVSVDADATAAKNFIAVRPGTPPTLQLKDASSASDWLSEIGLSSGSAIPVHSVLDEKGNLLCARAGGVSEAQLLRFRQVMFR